MNHDDEDEARLVVAAASFGQQYVKRRGRIAGKGSHLTTQEECAREAELDVLAARYSGSIAETRARQRAEAGSPELAAHVFVQLMGEARRLRDEARAARDLLALALLLHLFSGRS